MERWGALQADSLGTHQEKPGASVPEPKHWGGQRGGCCGNAGGTDNGWDLGGGVEVTASSAPPPPPFTADKTELREGREVVFIEMLPAPGAFCAVSRPKACCTEAIVPILRVRPVNSGVICLRV